MNIGDEEAKHLLKAILELQRKAHAHVRVIEILCAELMRLATKNMSEADEILAVVKRARIALQVRK